VLLGEGEEVRPATEALEELLLLPRGDDAETWGECGVCQLETNLVVALGGGSMGDVLRILRDGDLHLPLSDHGTGERRAEQVAVLVNGIPGDGREDEVGYELAAEIFDIHLARARAEGALAHLLEILVLADVRDIGDDVVPALLQDLEDAGGVQSSAVRQNYFLG